MEHSNITLRVKVKCPTLIEIQQYLLDNDWKCKGTSYRGDEPVYDVYARKNNDAWFEVIVPATEDFEDFSERVSELIEKLAISDDSSSYDIFNEMCKLFPLG